MKGQLFVKILFVIAIAVQISSVQANLEKLVHDVQIVLNTGNPYCVFYRDSVNAYIREYAPNLKCQLRCHNNDNEYAEQYPNWYIPNNLPVDRRDCATKGNNCNYKFDAEWDLGKDFLKMRDAEIFLKYVMKRSYICSK